MKDKVIIAIAKSIVWLENLRIEIQKHRFEHATKLAKDSLTAPKIYVTKIVNEEGYVIATLREVKCDKEPNVSVK